MQCIFKFIQISVAIYFQTKQAGDEMQKLHYYERLFILIIIEGTSQSTVPEKSATKYVIKGV